MEHGSFQEPFDETARIRTAEQQAISEVAGKIAASNSTIRDLQMEVDEKMAYGYDQTALIVYLEKIAPGSMQKILELTQKKLNN